MEPGLGYSLFGLYDTSELFDDHWMFEQRGYVEFEPLLFENGETENAEKCFALRDLRL